MKALTQEKKEKENVLKNLELINLKNVSLLQSEKLRKKIPKAERKFNGGQEGVLENSIAPISIIGEGIGIEEEFGSS